MCLAPPLTSHTQRAYDLRMACDGLISPVGTPDLHVMTYNIRRRFPHHRPWGADRSAARSRLVRQLLTAEQPTLLGVQEAVADPVD